MVANTVAILAAVIIATRTFADTPSAAIGGRVTSEGRIAAGVTVTVTSDALLRPRVTVTHLSGRYWVPALPGGEYAITFSREGLQTVTRATRLNAGEQARVDGDLAPSAEGERITTTAAMRSMFERPEIVWSIHRDTFDLLPLRRDAGSLLALSPLRTVGANARLPLDAVEQLSSVAGSEAFPTLMVTRPAVEKMFASIRATIQSDDDDRIEAAGGGPFRDRAALVIAATDEQVLFARGDLALGARHLLRARYFTDASEGHSAFDHVAAFDSRFTLATTYSTFQRRSFATRGFASLGRHELGLAFRHEGGDDAVLVNDRWIAGERWSLTGGLSFGGNDVRDIGTTIGTTFEVTSRDRLAAAYSDTTRGQDAFVAWGRQLQGNGYMRVSAVREAERDQFIADAMHDYLFLTLGGNYVIGEGERRASAWVIAAPPLIDQRLSLALLGRYRESSVATDVAIVYSRRVMRAQPFLKLELENAFDTPRSWRLGVGVRVE